MKELFKNCYSVEVDGEWYIPRRYTTNQRKEYSRSEYSLTRCDSPASVCLAFYSKAKSIKIEYEIGGKARDWAFFDVVTNGLLTFSKEVLQDKGVVELKLSGNEKDRTEIYLPHLVVVKIKTPIANEPLIPIKENKKFWLAIGDSITQGMVAKRPSFTYPVNVARVMGYELLNWGVGGDSFNAKQLDFVGREPDLITIALGCNDWDHFSLNEIQKNATDYVEKLCALYKCRNIYGILPIWRSDEKEVKKGTVFEDCRNVIKSVYQKYDFIKIIDGYNLVPHVKEFFGDPDELKVHPSDNGFLYYSLRLISELK